MNSQLQQTKMIKQTTYDKEDCLKSAQVYNADGADASFFQCTKVNSTAIRYQEQTMVHSEPEKNRDVRKITVSETLEADIRHRFWDLMSRPQQQSTEKTEIDLQVLLSSLNRSFSKTLKACWLARRLKTDFLWCSSEHGRSHSYRTKNVLCKQEDFQLVSSFVSPCWFLVFIVFRFAELDLCCSLWSVQGSAITTASSQHFFCFTRQPSGFLVTSLASQILAFQGGPWKTAHVMLNSQAVHLWTHAVL